MYSDSGSSIKCPRCLQPVQVYFDARQDITCNGCNFLIPLTYIRDSPQVPSVYIQLVGYTSTGKTMFLDVLRLHLYDMAQAWYKYGYYAQPLTQLDVDHKQTLFTERMQGKPPGTTTKRVRNQQEVYLMYLHQLPPRWRSCFLVLMDHSGEYFERLQIPVEDIPFLQHTPVAILLLSLPDMEREGKRIEDLLNSYVTSLEKMGVDVAQRQIIIVFNKADLIADLPQPLYDYLMSDTIYMSLHTRGQLPHMDEAMFASYFMRMSQVSAMIRDWVARDIPGGNSFLSMLRNKRIKVRFTIMSATGQDLSSAPGTVELRPRRVLDPFFWALEFYRANMLQTQSRPAPLNPVQLDTQQTGPVSGKNMISRGRGLALLTAIILIVLSSVIGASVYQNHADQLNVDATSTAAAPNYPSYLSGNGMLTLSDPLRDNSRGYDWEVGGDGSGYCDFKQSAFHVSIPKKGMIEFCPAQVIKVNNFVCQVEMSFVTGDRGGIVFRNDNTQGYYFGIGTDRSYKLVVFGNNFSRDLLSGSNKVIKPQESNTIAVMVQDTTISLYANSQKIGSISDSTLKSGEVSVAAEDVNNATEVAFNNVNVWTL